jgi:hypothetical protein
LNNRRQREDGKVFVSSAARCSVKTARKKSPTEAYFTADVIRPDMLWDKILRSPWRTRASSVNCQSRAKSSGRQGD